MDMPEEILKRDYSEEFDTLRKNRMVTSHYKYGWVSENYPTGLASAVGSLKKRLELYEKTGNREWLLDVANFAMLLKPAMLARDKSMPPNSNTSVCAKPTNMVNDEVRRKTVMLYCV